VSIENQPRMLVEEQKRGVNLIAANWIDTFREAALPVVEGAMARTLRSEAHEIRIERFCR
jgi:hypothetical protein